MIGWYVHHHGAGHVQRVLSVVPWLDDPVEVLSSAPRPEAWTGPWHELPRDDDVHPGRDPQAGGVLHWAPLRSPGLRARGAAVAAWVQHARPDLVVVDVSVEITLLVRLLGVPVAVVAMQGDRTDRPHLAAYDVADLLVAPWPADADVGRGLDRWRAKTAHVGAFSRFDARSAPAGRGRADGAGHRKVLLLWGNGGSDVDAAKVEAARAATPGWDWTVRTGTQGVTDVWPDLLDADVVVVHGGQNAVAEVAAARRPAVVVAQRRPHDEQEHRARTLRTAGTCVALDRWPETSSWPDLLEEASRTDPGRWSWWAPGDGARRAAEAIGAAARSVAT